jgi:hypothetical protein
MIASFPRRVPDRVLKRYRRLVAYVLRLLVLVRVPFARALFSVTLLAAAFEKNRQLDINAGTVSIARLP